MNLRAYTLSLLFLTISLMGFSQDYKKAIESEFTEYINLALDKEFEKSMEYIMPEVFEIIPMAQLIEIFEETFNDPEIEIKMTNPQIIAIQDSEKIDGKYYAFLTYTNEMKLNFFSDDDDYTEEGLQLSVNSLKPSLEQTFGAGNVFYNEETRFFEILTQKDVCAVSIDGISNWKFLEMNKDQAYILKRILPKELIDKM